MNPEISRHLDEAYRHLEEALNLSIQAVNADKNQQRPVGAQWEQFLGSFFKNLRVKGKEHKLNLLGMVSFTKLLKG
jgi:hypothetical protein